MQFSNCKLHSNFSDYYDNYLYLTDDVGAVVFHRNSDDQKNTFEQIEKLKMAGFLTPTLRQAGQCAFPYAPSLTKRSGIDYALFSKNGNVVHYSSEDNIVGDSESYIADLTFIGDDDLHKRVRYVQVGTKGVFLQACGVAPWPNKTQNEDFSVVETEVQIPCAQLMHLRSPIFSIDFIPLADGRLVAVGLNYAPHLASMEIDKLIPASDAAERITSALAISSMQEPIIDQIA